MTDWTREVPVARYRLSIRAVVGLVLLAAVAIGGVRITAGETPKKIRIIYTDDMLGAWIPCG